MANTPSEALPVTVSTRVSDIVVPAKTVIVLKWSTVIPQTVAIFPLTTHVWFATGLKVLLPFAAEPITKSPQESPPRSGTSMQTLTGGTKVMPDGSK